MANSYRSQMQRPPSGGHTHSVHGGDIRTPDAWRQREHNFHSRPPPQHQHHHRPQSAAGSTTTTADETSSELDTSVSGRRYNRLAAPPPPPVYARGGSNTLRSTRSVPALNLGGPPWADEPCPIHGGGMEHHHHNHHQPHHHAVMQQHPALILHPGGPPFHQPAFQPRYAPTMRRAGSMFDMRMSNGGGGPNFYPTPTYSAHPMPGFGPPPDKKSHYGSLRSIHSIQAAMHGMGGPPGPVPPPYHLPPMPPPHLLPPGMRPRPLVIPAGAEPLPVRDPAKSKSGSISGLNHSLVGPGGIPVLNGGKMGAVHDGDYKPRKRYHCCRGPLPLVWFIIAIVTLGVVLGVVLGSIYG